MICLINRYGNTKGSIWKGPHLMMSIYNRTYFSTSLYIWIGFVLKFWAAHLHQYDFKVTPPPSWCFLLPIDHLFRTRYITTILLSLKCMTKRDKRGFISQALDNEAPGGLCSPDPWKYCIDLPKSLTEYSSTPWKYFPLLPKFLNIMQLLPNIQNYKQKFPNIFFP